jgi:hypothetical protein
MTFREAVEEIQSLRNCTEALCALYHCNCGKCECDRVCAAAVEMAERMPQIATESLDFGWWVSGVVKDQLDACQAHVRKECGL